MLITQKYELSIWKNVWAKPSFLDEKGNVIKIVNEAEVIWDEEKSAVLSMDNFDFPGKAINIIFKSKINGTHELTFDLPSKYIDPSTGKKVKNYLKELIDNETKVKLKFKDTWYSFYVKKVTEKRDKGIMQYSYSCTDSYIVELSKIGYKITFNEYSKHYIEEIQPFAEDILDGSEWTYNDIKTKQLCDLTEYQEEKLVKYTVKLGGTNIYKIDNSDNRKLFLTEREGQSSIPKATPVEEGTILYGFYSEYNTEILDKYGNATNIIDCSIKQVLYLPEGIEEYVSGNTVIAKNCYYFVKKEDLVAIDSNADVPFEDNHRYGMRICYNPYTVYNKELDRYVKEYINTSSSGPTNLYSYTKSHIMAPSIAVNYAANSKNMNDTTGWSPQYAIDKLKVGRVENGSWTTDSNGLPALNGNNFNTYGIIAEDLSSDSGTIRVINSGPYSRKLKIENPTTFALRIDFTGCKHNTGNLVTVSNDTIYAVEDDYSTKVTVPITVKICQAIAKDINSYYSEIVTESSALDDDGNYALDYEHPLWTKVNITSGQYYLIKFDFSNNSNIKELTDLFIVIEASDSNLKNCALAITDLEFFEAWTYNGKHTEGTIVDPNNIVPSFLNGANTEYSNSSTNNIDISNNNEINYSNVSPSTQASAWTLYHNMEEQLKAWERVHENDYSHTLVTENSFTSGKAFDEELYFTVPAPSSQPAFGEPVVYYQSYSSNYEQEYVHTKYRTLKQEKSNRFNLTQQLSSLFKVYPVYEIEYFPNGKIYKDLYTQDGRKIIYQDEQIKYEDTKEEVPSANLKRLYSKGHKYLYYADEKGGKNYYGFKYGYNLNSISRTIDSDNIVTKMFVTDNANQYATDGLCSIARAKDNIGKDTYLFRFDYLINRKLIEKEQVDKDLYSRVIRKTYEFTEFINDTTNNPYRENLKNYDTTGNFYDFDDVILYDGFLVTIGEINTRYDAIAAEQASLEKHQLIVLEASVQTYTSAVKSLREQLAKQKNLTNAYKQEKTNKKWIEYYNSCQRIQSRLAFYESNLLAAETMFNVYSDLYNRYECEMQFLLYCKDKAERYFNIRYESFIREGVWQDSKYLEDNSYYLDAEKVLVDSCGPKITYTINVTDLSALPEYKFTDFGIGDITYIQDYEFFEDNPDTSEKYYEEKTIISALTYNLDNPSKNTISLQNYTTKFDDLFSRITASVQSLSFNENIYQRAARFTTNGQIDNNTIQETLNKNDLTLVNSQDVNIDGKGIKVVDLKIPSNQVKIVGSGIYLSDDGGTSWHGALESGGINASVLTIGSINTKSITISNENFTNFLWDANGITAYSTESIPKTNTTKEKEVTTASSFVRFNQFGLFFVKDNPDFEELLQKHYDNQDGFKRTNISKFLMGNANVAITYDGFAINGAENKVRFTSDNGIVMYDESNEEVVKLGRITGIKDIKDFWGLKAKGAYIEGSLITEKLRKRTIKIANSQNTQDVIDHSKTSLQGGKIQIERTIVKKEEGQEQITSSLNKITTFGSTFLQKQSSSQSNENNNSNENNEQSNPSVAVASLAENAHDEGGEDLDTSVVGSNIQIDRDGKFLSITAYQENKGNIVRILYAKDKLFDEYEADHLYVKCPVVTTTTSNTSDIRVKKNISPLEDKYLKLFDTLEPKTYNFINESNTAPKHIGLIAQEALSNYEKLGISQNEIGIISSPTKEKIASINYIELLTIAIAKIKQLEQEINNLKNKQNAPE